MALRDHAADILHPIVADIRTVPSNEQQFSKSRGNEKADQSNLIRKAGEVHARTRWNPGTMYWSWWQSIVRCARAWAPAKSDPSLTVADLVDIVRFNESIDQSLTMALERFTAIDGRSRLVFLATLGHDLRSPLAAILTNAQVLSICGKHEEQTAGMTDAICSTAKSMSKIIDDLLDFSASHLGASMPITTAPVELRSLCKGVADEVCDAFDHSHIDLHLPEKEIKGYWDRV